MKYRVLVPFLWYKRGQTLDLPGENVRIDTNYCVKKGVLEPVVPEEPAAPPKRKKRRSN